MRFLLIVLLSFILSGCYQNTSSLTDTLIYCSQNTPKMLNPQLNNAQETLDATTNQLFNRLVKINPENNNIEPDLSTHWEISEDKKSYTFHLRNNVSFHKTAYFLPTRYFNGEDVLFSFNRLIDKQSPFHAINSQYNNYFYNHPFKNLISNIEILNENTITISLKAPYDSFLSDLASHYAVIHSKEYGKQLITTSQQKNIDFYPIGTGPYQFISNNNTGVIRYDAHQGYWGAKPLIQHLIYDATDNNNKRYAKLLSGECDVMTNPAPSQLNVIRKTDAINVHRQIANHITLLAFNTTRQPNLNQYVRQALSYAIDQKGIVDAIFFDSATPANGLLIKETWAYDDNNPIQYYAPQVALRLLKEHSFDFNQTIKMLLPIKQKDANTILYKTAQFIGNNFESIGIKVKIIFLDNENIELFLASGDYDLLLSSMIIDENDPHDLFHALLGCEVDILEGNSSQWCNKKVEDLINSALHSKNRNLSKLHYYQLQELIQVLRPYYSVAHTHRIDISNVNIEGLIINPTTGINFQYVHKYRR